MAVYIASTHLVEGWLDARLASPKRPRIGALEVGGEALNLARQVCEGAVMPHTEHFILWYDVLILGQKIPVRELRSILVI